MPSTQEFPRPLPVQVVDRLGRYRRELQRWLRSGVRQVHSADLAARVGASPALVRRDLMMIGHRGSNGRGYDVQDLAQTVNQRLDEATHRSMVLVGLGNLGRAVLRETLRRQPDLRLVAAFTHPMPGCERAIDGIPVRGLESLEDVIHSEKVTAAVLAVADGEAQHVADRLVRSGVTSLLNLTSQRIRVPESVHIEDVDLGLTLLRTAFYGGGAMHGAA